MTTRGPGKPPSRRRQQKYNVSAEEFCRAWQLAESADEAAKKLKMPKPIVLARASTYRKAGILLKKMRRKPTRALDVAALNKLIKTVDEERGAVD